LEARTYPELIPQVTAHVYWFRKPSFLLPVDVYGSWVIFAVEEGEFRYFTGESEGKAAAGDLVICPPGMEFRRETITPLTFHFLKVEWNLSPPEALEAVPAGKLSILDRGRLYSTYAYLRKLANGYPNGRALARATRLFQDIWNLYEMEQEERQTSGELAVPSGDASMEQAAAEIRRLAFGPISLHELAARFGFSPVQFTRRFRAAYHQLPSEYLRSFRLSRACRLLAGTSLTLSEIAEQCGYESGFSLSRRFSGEFGLSPSEYRKTHRV